jgi:hypothetical protein
MYKEIHLMDKPVKNDSQDGEKYFCPDTGCHFNFDDLVHRATLLKAKREILDREIEKDSQ